MNFMARNLNFVKTVCFFAVIRILIVYYCWTTDKMWDDYFKVVDFNSLNSSNATCNYITMTYTKYMGMGNLMFKYASFYSIAKNNKKMALLSDDRFPLLHVFKLLVPVTGAIPTSHFVDLQESTCCQFDYTTDKIDCDKNTTLQGYRASWRYFDRYKNEIKKQFTFRKWIEIECNETLNKARKFATDTILIGVHMRRGDFVDNSRGYVAADPNYFQRSVEFYEDMFRKDRRKLIFLVLGNDYHWNKKYLLKQSNVIFLKPRSSAVDLCVLSKCNHIIFTTGTFGWWAAYLAGGHATYMKEQCRRGSTLCSYINTEDYFNAKWNWTAL